MSTLEQIEAAVEELPLSQQQQLLAYLQGKLASAARGSGGREAWLRRLDALRTRTKRGGTSSEDILAEMRADRFE